MFKNVKNYAVIKCFDLNADIVEKIQNIKNEGINIIVSNLYEDYSIIVENLDKSSIVFMSIVNDIKKIVGDSFYTDSENTLEFCVVQEAINKNIKIAVAESLTGGMVCSSIVNIPGSSAVLLEGFITYASESKVRRLHVKASTIDKFGPVSKQTCEEMIDGLLYNNKEIRLAVATTGCAGPGSDEFNTPIGKAYIGVGGYDFRQVKEVKFKGTREDIRNKVKNAALYMLLKYIRKI